MLDPWERWVQYHQLQIKSLPEEAPYIRFSDMVPHIVRRVNDGEAVKIVEKDTAALRISKARLYSAEQVLVLLIQYANKNVTDPSFQKLETGELRTEPKLEGEGVAVSAHVAISLEPSDDIDLPPDFRTKLKLVESVFRAGDGHEEAVFPGADHRVPEGGRGRGAGEGAVPQARLQ